MSDKQINPISRVDMDGPSRLAQITAQDNEPKADFCKKNGSLQQEERFIEQVGEAINQKLTQTNTTLKFQIDDETNEITVLIVDRMTDKILHTIPAEAIKNLPAGKLMQYFV